jgi:hypothetical protein
MLLGAGANPNLKDGKGRTVLNFAIGTSPEIFQVLLEAGTNPNTEDSDGRSPLSYAVERDNPKVVKKFSGLQMIIWKKLFTWKVHLHGVSSGALALSMVWLACACQGSPKK